jgi:predicted dehydrogenase
MSEPKTVDSLMRAFVRVRRVALGTLVGAALAAAGSASAHHSFAVFDMSQQKTIEGTVSDFQWTNPHTWTWVDVKGDDGSVVKYGFEGMSPNFLGRRGWSKNTLKPGDHVKIVYAPLKSGEPGGTFLRATLKDGTEMVMFGGGPAN